MRWVAAGLIAALALVAIAFLARDAGQDGVAPEIAQATAGEQVEDRAVVPPESSLESRGGGEAVALPDLGTGDARSPEPSVLGGRVTGRDGRGVVGAVVSWSPLPESVNDAADWQAGGSSFAPSTLLAASDENGAFGFDRGKLGPAPHGAVIWITHPEHSAAHRVLGVDDAKPKGSTDLGVVELEAVSPRTVEVLASGEGVAGARVLQFAVAKDGATADDIRARRAFFREWKTNGSGEALVAAFPGREGLVARHEDRTSEPVTRECLGDVSLELLPSFDAQGSVVLTDGAKMPDGVRVYGEVRSGEASPEAWVRQTSVPVQEDSSWGPMALALTGAGGYRFVAEGAEVVREDVEVANPEAGQILQVDIETRLGVSHWFAVRDSETGELLEESRVETYWPDEFGGWVMVEHRPRDDGYILARGLPPGPIYYIARCEGFAFHRGGPDVLPPPEAYTRDIDLFRAGRLEGRCSHAGEPVRDFQVLYWPRSRPDQLEKKAFQGRDDGRFVVEEVAAGDLTILAQARDFGQSEPLRFTVPVGGTAEVELELPAGEVGRGTVVDQLTGAPVPGARVEVFFTFGARPLSTTGITTVTGSQGRFELEGLSQVQTTFLIDAPGYSQKKVTARAASSSAVDLGRIELLPAQPFEIRLHHHDGDDPTLYTARSQGKGLTASRFSPDGIVFVEEFSPLYFTLRVNTPNGETLMVPVDLRPGQDWIVDVDVDGPCRLDLLVKGREGAGTGDLWAAVKYPEDRGGVDWSVYVPESGQVAFEHLPPGRVQIELSGAETVVASVPFELAVGQENFLEIAADRAQRRIRVVDVEGRPLASTRVRFLVDGSEDARLGGTTDAQGEIASAGLETGELSVHLEHPSVGFVSHVPVERAATPDEVVEVVFEADERMSVVVLDGERPASNVSCQLHWKTSMDILAEERTTDATGAVEWHNVGEGEYEFHADHPAYWPLRIDLAAGETTHRVQMRRRGDLLVRALEPDGSELAGATVQIASLELGTDVAEWVRSGAVKGAAFPLRTNPDGELELIGLPRGEYRWEVLPPSGEPVTGTVTVPGGDRVVVVAK